MASKELQIAAANVDETGLEPTVRSHSIQVRVGLFAVTDNEALMEVDDWFVDVSFSCALSSSMLGLESFSWRFFKTSSSEVVDSHSRVTMSCSLALLRRGKWEGW